MSALASGGPRSHSHTPKSWQLLFGSGESTASRSNNTSEVRTIRISRRAAITLLLLSEHPLSVEQLRRGPTRIARELRICRWCTQHWAVEDETHVLLECEADTLTDLRETFLNTVFAAVPSFRKAYFRLSSAALLDMLLRGSTTLPMLASYVADVFELCATTPPLLPQDNAPNLGATGRA